jgi:unsaturated rhamnogalacturonyl hydrolase
MDLTLEQTLRERTALVANATITMMRGEYQHLEPAIRRWDWQPGVGLYGLVRAYEALGDRRYLDYCKTYVDDLLDRDKVSYSVNGAIVFEIVLKLFEHVGDMRYKEELRHFLRWLLHSAPRCQNDCFQHTWNDVKVNLVEQVWIDTVFMTGIVLADCFQVLGRQDCREEAALQFAAHQRCLQDAKTGLCRHIYETTSDGHMAGAFWGRGNGWMAASAVDVLEAIGVEAEEHQPIIISFRQQLETARKLQEADGMFHTILDDKSTYREMSATAALGYAALKGVRMGILDDRFLVMGRKAAEAALDNIQADGIVDNVSSGTSGFIAYDDYNQIPIAPRLYGQALTILLMTEYLCQLETFAR